MPAVPQWDSNDVILSFSWTDAIICKFVCGVGNQQSEMSCN